jgi:DNA-nicking Smr family endonuclease
MAERRRPSRDEAELWKAVTRDVKRLERKPPPPGGEPEPASETGKKTQKTGKIPKKPPAGTIRAAGAMAPTPPSSPELTHGRATGVDRRTVDRLRRGQIAIEAEIDLHGHTQDEAHRALQAFVSGQAGAGRRCVRVVTGKGAFREGGGVLKTAVPRWLNESPLREQVLAFSHARRDDGGEGALYVLLRRKRPKPGPQG